MKLASLKDRRGLFHPMSCRDWLHKVAIGGCLIGAMLLALGGGPSCAKGDAGATSQETERQERDVFLERNLILQSVVYKPNCEQPVDHDAADYCQQQRMAKAAEDAVWWSRLQTWLGGFGFIVVVGTLILNIRATGAASRAATAAERAIIVENRPWIRLEPQIATALTIDQYGGRMGFDVRFKNVGRGPARIAYINTGEIDFFADDLARELAQWIQKNIQAIKNHEGEYATVFPGETYLHHAWVRLTKEMMDRSPIYGDGKEKMLSPVISFAIFYRTTIEAERIYYTAETYTLATRTERGPRQALVVRPVIEAKTIAFDRYEGLSRAI